MSSPSRAAIIVPDESTWLLWGEDIRRRGLRPTSSAIQASAMAAAAELPGPLAEAVSKAWAEMAPERELVVLGGPPLGGTPAAEAVAHGGHDHDEHDQAECDPSGHAHGHDEHGGHDHAHMMEVTGEPSADGLVMENIDFETGPLTPGLPAGLSLTVSLDGDVVGELNIRAILRAEAGALIPDPLCAASWRIATVVAAERAAGITPAGPDQWGRLAAVEIERAASHLAWLHRVGVVLGWQGLAERAKGGALPLAGLPTLLLLPKGQQPTELRGFAAQRLESSQRVVAEILKGVMGGRLLAVRTHAIGCVDPTDPRLATAGGPTARANGSSDDRRSVEPAYDELGFTVESRDGGDALARTQVRMAEADQSLRLATAALERVGARAAVPGDEPLFSTPAGAVVESPRGLVLASEVEPGAPVLHASPGAAAKRDLAAAAVRGAEWAAALVGVASFDLSPWEVRP